MINLYVNESAKSYDGCTGPVQTPLLCDTLPVSALINEHLQSYEEKPELLLLGKALQVRLRCRRCCKAATHAGMRRLLHYLAQGNMGIMLYMDTDPPRNER